MKPLIVVAGATGNQGGSVVNALLASGKWSVRALTRKVDSEKAKSLRDRGVEVVKCEMDNLDEVVAAFKGAHGVFAVTQFWEVGEEREQAEGKNMIEAALQNNVPHFVWSSLDNYEVLSGGKYHVPHFTGKAKVQEVLAKSGLTWTTVVPSAYYQNILFFHVPKPAADGVLEFSAALEPNSKWANFDVNDTGAVVAAVFENKELYSGKTLPLVGDLISPNEIAAILSKEWGKTVRYKFIPPEVMEKSPGAEEVAHMWAFANDYGYYGENKGPNAGRDIWEAKRIHPQMKTYEQFIKSSDLTG